MKLCAFVTLQQLSSNHFSVCYTVYEHESASSSLSAATAHLAPGLVWLPASSSVPAAAAFGPGCD